MDSEKSNDELDLGPIFERAAQEGASDVIISANVAPVLYVGGKMLRYGSSPLSARDTQRMIYGVLHSDQIARLERDKELDFSLTFDHGLRFRGNAFWQRGTLGAAFRLITNDIPSLDQLGLPQVLRTFAEVPQGLLLVTGPTGHGKSTTLASMINHINTSRSCHIVTVEDPIEFIHTNQRAVIEQREVGTDTLSFASAVRHVLRQAPHIILVGEMRDTETISAVLTAAETGHLVLATLHTNDAAQTVDRIVDVFPPNQQNQIRVQLSMSLLGVISQRLMPHINGRDRVLACEVLRCIPSVAHLIREGKTAQIPGMIETGGKHGMQAMDSAIKKHYLDGNISEETARQVMRNPANLFG